MNALLALPIVVPLLAAALTVIATRRPALQRALTLVGVTTALGASIAILVQVDRDGPQATQVGGWPVPIGISLVADLFSALMLVIGLATVLAVLVFAIGQRGDAHESGFHPVYLVMTAGVALSFLTGDLFNLFVAFEITLTASYVLITLGGAREQVRAGMTYVVINLLASFLFVAAIAFVYAATGTMNFADLAGKIATLSPALKTSLSLLLLVVFGIKAAIFPLYFWLPDAYPTARTPVTAVFAGLLTKVGVYSIIRTQTLLFPDDHQSTLLLVIVGFTMVVGVLGAIAQDDMKRILSFHIVSQIGYMILGVGLFTVSGLAGAVFFVIHQIPVKASLFLVGGLVEHDAGSTKLSHVGGLVRRIPLVAVLFLVAALSLAGIPPLSGFVGKLALVSAGLDAQEYAIIAVSLLVSVGTLFSMVKIWNGVFWGNAEEPTPAILADDVVHTPALMTVATVALVGLTVAIALAAGPIYALCERAATDLLDPTAYITAVQGMTRVLRIVVLAGIWVALWGEVSVANVVFGLAVALVVTFAFPPLDHENGNGINLPAAAIFFAKFAVMLVQSTWSVVVEVVRPTLALEEAIVAVPLRTDDPVIVTMVANGITLTPGTLTVDVGPDPVAGEGRILYVHALTLGAIDDLIAGAHELEDLAIAAFPPPAPRPGATDPIDPGSGAELGTAPADDAGTPDPEDHA